MTYLIKRWFLDIMFLYNILILQGDHFTESYPI